MGTRWYQFTDENNAKYSLKRIPVNEELYRVQKEIIHDMAAKSPCVIIGRGADYILRNNDKLLSVFVIADKETKVENVTAHYNLDRESALELMKKTDKQRKTTTTPTRIINGATSPTTIWFWTAANSVSTAAWKS